MKLYFAIIFLTSRWATGLVPHSFWNPRTAPKKKSRRSANQLKMYFDDCEREDNVKPFSARSQQPQQSWIMSRSEEKQTAMNRLLGFNFQSSLELDDEQMEDEILRWALETNVLWDGDDEEDKDKCKYLSLSDLTVDSSCATQEQCLATLWKILAKLLEKQDFDSVHWVAFPRCQALWNYDTMVTVLRAIQVSRPQIGTELQIDLFHPKYKNAPNMFSPETHSPFPTVSLQLRDNQPNLLDEDDDTAMTRAKLEALFDSVDTVPESFERQNVAPIDVPPGKVLQDSQLWLDTNDDHMEWIVEMQQQPFHVYAAIWNAVCQLLDGSKASSSSLPPEAMIVAPNLDAHTLHRVAITVNVAFQRLNSRIRVANVYHPNNPKNSSRKSPYGMIRLGSK